LSSRWGKMWNEVGAERRKELMPLFEKLHSIALKSTTTETGTKQARAASLFQDLEKHAKAQSKEKFDTYISTLEQALKKKQKEDPDNPRVKAALDMLKHGKLPFGVSG